MGDNPTAARECCYNRGCAVAQHDSRLVVVAGEGGKNGMLGNLRGRMTKAETGIESNKREIWASKLSTAKWSGLATGLVLGIAELLRRYA